MHSSIQRSAIVSLFLSLSFLIAGPAFAQDASVGRHTVGGFVGFTDRDDVDFSVGGEYDYRLRRQWSIGAVAEHTPDAYGPYDATVLMGTAKFHPASMQRLQLIGGLGAEFKDIGGDDLKFRVGAGYDVFREGSITITPRVTVDFGEGDENVVFGVTAFYGL